MKTFLDNFVDFVSEFSVTDKNYIKYTGLMAISTMLGNRVYFEAGTRKIYTNMYMMFIADSGISCKSEAPYVLCQSFLKKLEKNSGVDKEFVFPSRFSIEEFVKSMSKNPSGIFYFDEYSDFLAMLERNSSKGIIDKLTQYYEFGGGIDNLRYLSWSADVIDPSPSFLTATTKTALTSNSKTSQVTDQFRKGFNNRFIYILGEKPDKFYEVQPSYNRELHGTILYQLRQLLDIRGMCKFNSEASKWFSQWCQSEFKICQSGKCGEFYPSYFMRLQRIISKLSILYQINSDNYDLNNIIIDSKSMEIALCEAEFLKHYFSTYYLDNVFP